MLIPGQAIKICHNEQLVALEEYSVCFFSRTKSNESRTRFNYVDFLFRWSFQKTDTGLGFCQAVNP